MDAVAFGNAMESLGKTERSILHISSDKRVMPMITCEEPVDISYLGRHCTEAISDAIVCSTVGELRERLDNQLQACLLSELCEDNTPEGSHGAPPVRSFWEEFGA